MATKTDAEGYVTSYEYDGNGNCVKMTTVDGDTIYEYDPLDRLIKTTTPDGESTSMTYDGVGNITSSTDANGNTTQYKYDGVGNVVETIDALGTSAFFEYDSMGNLVKTRLHRVDTQDNVDEWEVTLYEFDGRGLATKQVDALGNVTTNYDGSYLNKSVLAGGGHLQYDMIPYYFYGNTSNDPLKKFASINASDDNRDRYDEIKDDRENLIMKKRIEFINEWKAAGGLFEEKYYTEGLL